MHDINSSPVKPSISANNPDIYTRQQLTVFRHSAQIVNETMISISNNACRMHKSSIKRVKWRLVCLQISACKKKDL